jgi:hypothetical protein
LPREQRAHYPHPFIWLSVPVNSSVKAEKAVAGGTVLSRHTPEEAAQISATLVVDEKKKPPAS